MKLELDAPQHHVYMSLGCRILCNTGKGSLCSSAQQQQHLRLGAPLQPGRIWIVTSET